ncbi:hypothetical protein HY251_03945 [bacterium]|nr:hypothetical protein [bacterium]
MSSAGENESTVLVAAPLAAYFLGAAIGLAGAFLPYLATSLVDPWLATRASLATSALAAVFAHVLLRALARSGRERAAGAFVVASLLPAAAVGAAAISVFALSPELRAPGYAAFVANAAASSVDLWEAFAVARLRPLGVQARAGGLACRVAPREGR